MATVDALGDAAVRIASRAAWMYIRQHDLTATTEALSSCLTSWCKIKLPEALRDAKAALDAHMPQAAEATFQATMALAGIEAAREAGFPTSHTVAPAK